MTARHNDFSISVATVNGSGSQTANSTLLRAMFQMGVPVSGKNLFPSNIAGLPTWFVIRASEEGYLARGRIVDALVAMNAETAVSDVASTGPGSIILMNEAIPAPPIPDDRTVYRIPFNSLVEPLVPDAKRWVDLGSGAGFPGLVIACALANTAGAAVHLVESNAKKAAFLREAARHTGAPAFIHAVRIEEFVQNFAEQADAVTARGLAPLQVLLKLAYPLLKTGAPGVFPKGQDVDAELTKASKCWNIHAELVPSKTDSQSRIVVVSGLQPRPGAR